MKLSKPWSGLLFVTFSATSEWADDKEVADGV